MPVRPFLLASFLVVTFGLAQSLTACGDDDTSTTSDAGTAGKSGSGAGTGGSAGSKTGGSGGGKAGSGGSQASGRGGAGGAGGAGGTNPADLYTCKPAAPQPGGSALAGAACCGGLGVCTKNPTGPAAASYGLSECKAGQDLKCVPSLGGESDAGSDDAGVGVGSASCRVELPANLIGNLDLEGRCVPSCFVASDPSASNLGRSTCSADSKCAPCYSPITGETTGACSQAGDRPRQPAPPGFKKCGDGDIGYCVTAGAAAMSGMNVMLPQLTCVDGEVCAPKLRVLDAQACFAHCDSQIGGPGACIAAFIIPEANRSFLVKSSCAAGEVCAPCVSPLDNTATGACR
jgi:hypothetical protein